MNEEQVRNWLKAQDMGYLLETLDTVAMNPKLSDWAFIMLSEKLADILLELDYAKCQGDCEEAEKDRKGFNYYHSAQCESGL